MTLKEAKEKSRYFLKLDIRNRLHKYNPSKYPKPRMYTAGEAFEVAITIAFDNDRVRNMFERDDIFFRFFK